MDKDCKTCKHRLEDANGYGWCINANVTINQNNCANDVVGSRYKYWELKDFEGERIEQKDW